MNTRNPYQTYKNNAILTASPIMLIVMLYDGALKFMVQAEKCLETNDYMGWNNYIKRSQNILTELSNCLNMDAGEVAQNLKTLYSYCYEQTVWANINRDPAKLHHVAHILSDLKYAWEEVNKKYRNQTLAGASSAARP